MSSQCLLPSQDTSHPPCMHFPILPITENKAPMLLLGNHLGVHLLESNTNFKMFHQRVLFILLYLIISTNINILPSFIPPSFGYFVSSLLKKKKFRSVASVAFSISFPSSLFLQMTPTVLYHSSLLKHWGSANSNRDSNRFNNWMHSCPSGHNSYGPSPSWGTLLLRNTALLSLLGISVFLGCFWKPPFHFNLSLRQFLSLWSSQGSLLCCLSSL